MADYKISGVWKDDRNAITHYAMHLVRYGGLVDKSVKTTKAEAIRLLSQSQNYAVTWMWDYRDPRWKDGERVEVVQSIYGPYLRSNRDNKLTDNLAHLINYQPVY